MHGAKCICMQSNEFDVVVAIHTHPAPALNTVPDLTSQLSDK